MAKKNKYPDINFKDKDVDKITAGRDTTVIKTPYKVTTKEIATDEYSFGLASPTVQDSTRKKIAYNLSEVIPSMVKRNVEREKEGKNPISKSSIMGNTVGGFSNKGKSFSSSPIKNKKK